MAENKKKQKLQTLLKVIDFTSKKEIKNLKNSLFVFQQVYHP